MRLSVFLPAAIILSLLCLNVEWLVAHDPTVAGAINRAELIPYILIVGLAAFWPPVLMARFGWFSILHPVVHVSWTYVFPILIAGSFLFVLVGVSDTPDTMIFNPSTDYRATLLYIGVGLAALGLGATFQWPRLLALRIGRKLPALEWSSGECVATGVVLLFIGTLFQYANFRSGLIGYQLGKSGAFTALLYYLGLTFQMGIFLVWFGVFLAHRIRFAHILAGGVFLLCILFVAVLSGSRGLLISCWIVIVLASVTSSGWPKGRRIVLLGLAGCIMLAGGFTVGTLFRQTKSTVSAREISVLSNEEAQPSLANRTPVPTPSATAEPIETSQDLARFAQRKVTLGDQAAIVGEAVTTASSGNGLPNVLRSFAARVNVLTQVTVLVSQRDALMQSLPPSLRNGIINGVTTALIPRALWPNKPVIGDTAAHARVFFQFEGNAFAITPMGDLLLNFGPAGIVPGMIFLGMLMTVVHAALVGAYPLSGARAAILLGLLTQFSIEGFYAPIIPGIIRAGLVGLVTVLLAQSAILFSRQIKRRHTGTEAAHAEVSLV